MAKKEWSITVHVPVKNADAVRQAMGTAIGPYKDHYRDVSFTYPGTGRFTPLKGARPSIGKIGKPEKVAEVAIETVVSGGKKKLENVILAVQAAHPYESPGITVIRLEKIKRKKRK